MRTQFVLVALARLSLSPLTLLYQWRFKVDRSAKLQCYQISRHRYVQ